jgi:hypothetical protein
MYYTDDSTDFVKENDFSGYASNLLLKETGEIYELHECHEKPFHYGYGRKKKGKKKLGRAVKANEAQERVHRKRVNNRRQKGVIDLCNCNEGGLPIWHTFTYAANEQDIEKAQRERQKYEKRLERFVQTGKLWRKPVTAERFTPKPDFKLKAVGVIDFQDGERREDKQGREVIHFHQVQNTTYLPQVQVITAQVSDGWNDSFKQAYLQQDHTWSLTANRETLWFNTRRESWEYLKKHKATFRGMFKDLACQPLCVAALLWEHGYIKIKTIQNMRKTGKLSNVGEYMVSKYMVKNTDDTRLNGHKAYFKVGDVERPKFYRDQLQVSQILEELNIWETLVEEFTFCADYLGWMTFYKFNFWVLVYPWIKRYYERKNQKQEMTKADWLASQLEEIQPLLL